MPTVATPVTPTCSLLPGLRTLVVEALCNEEVAVGINRCVMILAPLEAGVIPLPHQLHALSRAVTGDRVRFLLADEVGLMFRELKLRGLAN